MTFDLFKISSVSVKKLGTFCALLTTLAFGIYLTGTFCMPVLHAIGLWQFFPQFINSLVNFSIYLLGSALTMGVFLQGLKYFNTWPMEINSPISFFPNDLLNDVITVLRSMDMALLRCCNTIILHRCSPKIKAFFTEEELPDDSWWNVGNRIRIGVTNWAKRKLDNFQKEELSSAILKTGVSTQIHMLSVVWHNSEKLETEQGKASFVKEQDQYFINHFFKDLKGKKAGLIESVGGSVVKTLFEEYQHPPKLTL